MFNSLTQAYPWKRARPMKSLQLVYNNWFSGEAVCISCIFLEVFEDWTRDTPAFDHRQSFNGAQVSL